MFSAFLSGMMIGLVAGGVAVYFFGRPAAGKPGA
jgi:hypothetical protein